MPAVSRIPVAAETARWARAPAPSVTLTASASPRSGSAFLNRSSGSQLTGGATSAVITNWPECSRCSSPVAVIEGGALSFISYSGSVGACGGIVPQRQGGAPAYNRALREGKYRQIPADTGVFWTV